MTTPATGPFGAPANDGAAGVRWHAVSTNGDACGHPYCDGQEHHEYEASTNSWPGIGLCPLAETTTGGAP